MKSVTVRRKVRPQALEVAPAPAPWVDLALIPSLLAVATFTAFMPVLTNDFVNWDDDTNLFENFHYRGLGWEQLRWMFTTFLMGHYIPLTWMTFALDYLVWGLRPAGYHLTNLLLHVANMLIVYFLALRILRANMPERDEHGTIGLRLAAAFTSLIFAVHPLRVESVAWATERRDVLSGLFYLLAIMAYLRSRGSLASQASQRGDWYWASVGLHALALLSKSMAVTLPVILVILDIYPLRRFTTKRGERWQVLWSVCKEKVPFIVLSLVASTVALVAAIDTGSLTSISKIGWVDRVAISLYAFAFYLWKMIVPVGLSPLYALPTRIAADTWPFHLSATVVPLVTGVCIAVRRRWPAFAAVWAAYIVMLLPVVGIAHNGPQIAADRYTYLPCIAWSILAGAGLARAWRASNGRKINDAIAILLIGLTPVTLAGLGILTWNQVNVWRDSETLWTRAVATRPSALAHFKLGVTLADQGRMDGARHHLEEALRIDVRHTAAHSALGFVEGVAGSLTKANQHFQNALRIDPDAAEAHIGLGQILTAQGKLIDAEVHFRRALRSNPKEVEAHNFLGLVLTERGELEEADTHFKQAARLSPRHAAEHLQKARQLRPQTGL